MYKVKWSRHVGCIRKYEIQTLGWKLLNKTTWVIGKQALLGEAAELVLVCSFVVSFVTVNRQHFTFEFVIYMNILDQCI